MGICIFFADWVMKLLYPRYSKFVTYEVYEFYMSFLYGRLIFIGLYHLYLFVLQIITKSWSYRGLPKRTIACAFIELITQTILLPASMVTGVYRLVLRDRDLSYY